MGLAQHFEMSTVHLSLEAVAWLDEKAAAFGKDYGAWAIRTPYGWLACLPNSSMPECLVEIAEYVNNELDDDEGCIYILFDVDGEVIEALDKQYHYIIQHVSARDDETGEPLTWNNTLGWGLGEPTIYRADEKESCQLPGLDCKWVERPLEKVRPSDLIERKSNV